MAKAVRLPPVIIAKFNFDGKINETGVHMLPTLPYLYKPFLSDLAEQGFVFKKGKWLAS